MNICGLFSGINWWCYAAAAVLTFAFAALWYSVLFAKTRARVFKEDIPEKMSVALALRTMGMQFAINALFGLWFFVLATHLGFWFALITLCVFCGWQKGMLNFQFPKFKDYMTAAMIDAGYTFIVGMVFILFAFV